MSECKYIFEALTYCNDDPVNFVDPSGHAAGDVWLYRGSDTSTSNLAENAQSFVGKDSNSGHNYSHASIEINEGNQFTAEGKGGAQIQDFDKALNNHSGQVDIYRHKNASSFNSNKATDFAKNRSNRAINVYGLNGVCSTVARDAAQAGDLSISRGSFITSPNDLSNSRNLNKVGTYDNILRMSYE